MVLTFLVNLGGQWRVFSSKQYTLKVLDKVLERNLIIFWVGKNLQYNLQQQLTFEVTCDIWGLFSSEVYDALLVDRK